MMSAHAGTNETAGANHCLHVSFCRGLRNCLLKWDKVSVNDALDIFMKDEKGGKGLVREVAKSNMLETRRYMEGIMNYVEHNRDLVENEAMEVFNNIKSKDMALAEAAKQAKRPYRSYIKKPVEGVQRGTEAHLENFLKHVQKGCYEDPLPVKEMNLPSKKELENRELKLPPKLIRLRGTNICEITNKHFNWIGEHITRQSTDVTHAKALLFVFRHNQNRDTKVQHLTGVLPKTLDWYIREALQSEVEDIVVNPLGNENFPPDFDRDQHMEPVGKHYQLYSMWGQITQEIDKLMKKRDVSILLSKQDSNDKPASGSYALVSNNTAASSTDDKAFVVDSDGIGHGNSSVETSPVAKLPRRNANTTMPKTS